MDPQEEQPDTHALNRERREAKRRRGMQVTGRSTKTVLPDVIARRGREHVYDNLDPSKTALVVVDMQNAFMLPGVAHSLVPVAQEIVPNINRLAEAVRGLSCPVGCHAAWLTALFARSTALRPFSPTHSSARFRCLPSHRSSLRDIF